MTVKELMARLAELPPSCEVLMHIDAGELPSVECRSAGVQRWFGEDVVFLTNRRPPRPLSLERSELAAFLDRLLRDEEPD